LLVIIPDDGESYSSLASIISSFGDSNILDKGKGEMIETNESQILDLMVTINGSRNGAFYD
jgi:hypothetical protein